MPDSLEIRDVNTLADLRSALAQFSADVPVALKAAAKSIAETLEWFDERAMYWQRKTDLAHTRVQQAQVELIRTQASGYRDRDGKFHQADCSREQAALRRATEELRTAEENNGTVRAWRSRVTEAADSFLREARRLEQLADNHTSRAKTELSSLHERYEAVHRQQVALGIAGAFADGKMAVAPTNAFAAVASQGGLDIKGDWQTKDAYVAVNTLPDPQGISGDGDFRKVPSDEMRAGLRRLQEMMPVIQSGDGADPDYWSHKDAALGLEHNDGYRRIYDAFYGDNAIRVTLDNGVYDIINGRHRIWLAKQMGITTLPVRLVERDRGASSSGESGGDL